MNILAFFAHPDDETMLAGGTLALLARQGAAVHYLCATRGEGGEAGEPPLCTLEKLGNVRSQELACAVEALGGASLAYMEYIDPRVGPDNTLYPFADDSAEVVRKLMDHIERIQAGSLVCHGSSGEYGHPAHKLAHQAARTAIEQLGEHAPLFYTVQAAFEGHPKPRLANVDDPAHLVFNLGPVMEAKTQATLCHKTQHALFVRNASRQQGRPVTVPEVVTGIESLHRVYPPVEQRADDLLAELIRHSGLVQGE
jgi:LmbE family N-acetylglucosaminyl deacetylase